MLKFYYSRKIIIIIIVLLLLSFTLENPMTGVGLTSSNTELCGPIISILFMNVFTLSVQSVQDRTIVLSTPEAELSGLQPSTSLSVSLHSFTEQVPAGSKSHTCIVQPKQRVCDKEQTESRGRNEIG